MAQPLAADADTSAAPVRSRADERVRRLLCIRPDAGTCGQERAQRTFSTSIAVSTVRCLLTYVVLPYLAPAAGLATGVGPALGVVIGAVAIAANVMSIRRFWASDHPWRWTIGVISTSVIGLLLVLVAVDLAQLLG